MKRTSARISRISSIGTSGNQTRQYQESTAGGVGLPISVFPSMFWRPVRHEIKHCYAGELLCRVLPRIAVIFFSVQFKRINWSRYRSPVMVSLGWSSSYPADPTKYRTQTWSHRYSALPWMSMYGRAYPMTFFILGYHSLPLEQLFTCEKNLSRSLGFNSYGTLFSCF